MCNQPGFVRLEAAGRVRKGDIHAGHCGIGSLGLNYYFAGTGAGGRISCLGAGIGDTVCMCRCKTGQFSPGVAGLYRKVCS
jgi:hypothetical protein